MENNEKSTDRVWFITGCSTGLGRALAVAVLKAGYKAVVTARHKEQIEDITVPHQERGLALRLDVTDRQEIQAAVQQAEARFGRIDVLVNNAGIGYFAAIEESEEAEYRKMFEINFFGLHEVTRQVLPIMRRQRSGHIVNIASIAGLVGFPAVGFYNATKFAVHGYSESLAKETAPLGIRVTVISPSGFRTDWAGRSARTSPVVIDDYKDTAGLNKENLRNYSGKQPGDPQRAAEAIIQVTESQHPPLHLLLGAAALRNARIKLEHLRQDMDAWEKVTTGADFPADTSA